MCFHLHSGRSRPREDHAEAHRGRRVCGREAISSALGYVPFTSSFGPQKRLPETLIVSALRGLIQRTWGRAPCYIQKSNGFQSSSAREDANDLAGLPLLGSYFRLAGSGRGSRVDRALGARAFAVHLDRIDVLVGTGDAGQVVRAEYRRRARYAGLRRRFGQRALLCAGPDLRPRTWRGADCNCRLRDKVCGRGGPAEFHLRGRRAQPAHWQEGLRFNVRSLPFFRCFVLRHLCLRCLRDHATVHAESHDSLRSLLLEHVRRRRGRGELGNVADQKIAEKQSTEFSPRCRWQQCCWLALDCLPQLLKDTRYSSLLPPRTRKNWLQSLLS